MIGGSSGGMGVGGIEVIGNHGVDRIDTDVARDDLSATALTDGRVMVIGGKPPGGGDPVGDVVATDHMTIARAGHQALRCATARCWSAAVLPGGVHRRALQPAADRPPVAPAAPASAIWQHGQVTKTTVELPSDLLRRVKARAAEQGRSMKSLVTEALENMLRQGQPASRGWRAVFGRAEPGARRDVDRHVSEVRRVDARDWE